MPQCSSTAERNKQRQQNYAQTAGHQKRKWNIIELKLMQFGHFITDRQLSKAIGRSVQAIQIKRSRIRKIESHKRELANEKRNV